MLNKSKKAPLEEKLVNLDGKISNVWQSFIRLVEAITKYLGEEKQFTLVNNQVLAANITGLKFDKRYSSCAFIEYFIQRTSSSGQLIEAGIKICTYDPRNEIWEILEYGTPGPDASGVTLSITTAGQVQYVSTNQAGTGSISRICYRVREIAGKHSTYSLMGGA